MYINETIQKHSTNNTKNRTNDTKHGQTIQNTGKQYKLHNDVASVPEYKYLPKKAVVGTVLQLSNWNHVQRTIVGALVMLTGSKNMALQLK
jgi:hypothetical protein